MRYHLNSSFSIKIPYNFCNHWCPCGVNDEIFDFKLDPITGEEYYDVYLFDNYSSTSQQGLFLYQTRKD